MSGRKKGFPRKGWNKYGYKWFARSPTPWVLLRHDYQWAEPDIVVAFATLEEALAERLDCIGDYERLYPWDTRSNEPPPLRTEEDDRNWSEELKPHLMPRVKSLP